MTIIIGAELDDGRKVLYGDGMECIGPRIVRSGLKKVQKVETKLKSRKALVATCGAASAMVIVPDIILSYLSTACPRIEDLYYRVKKETQGLPDDEKPEALLWVPDHDEVHRLVHLDSSGYPMVQNERNFHAVGAASCEATSALFAMAVQDTHATASTHSFPLDAERVMKWRPSLTQLMVAMKVATMTNVDCGGDCTLIEL